VGGRQRKPRPLHAGERPWEGYERAIVLEMDLRSQSVRQVHQYVSPDDVVSGPDAAISFQSSSVEGHLLYTCTQTEVIVYSLPSFERLHYVSLPCFNDIHHVRSTPSGNILAANAGLEMVLELKPSGEIVEAWSALGEDPWERVDPSVDYRKISTKPHRAHPNFVFYVGSEIWATRFEQGDAISVSPPGRSVQVSDRRIHDGIVVDGRIYFTTVDGTIVVVDASTLEIEEVVDLPAIHGDRALLGWCRGLLLSGEHLWVGFSRIRPTQFRENVAWVARGFRRGKPTHIACYDLARRACVTEIDLEPTGLAAVYSILPAAAPDGSG
jgi:PQQ-like domain